MLLGGEIKTIIVMIRMFSQICRKMNEICGGLLTKGFQPLKDVVKKAVKRIRARMLRQSNFQTDHDLKSRLRILESIETVISYLNKHLRDYVKQQSYFYPGKVIDEIRRLLMIVESSQVIDDLYLLDVLRNMSHMVVAHHEDHVSRLFPKNGNRFLFQPENPVPKPLQPSSVQKQSDEEMPLNQHQKEVADLKARLDKYEIRMASYEERLSRLEDTSKQMDSRADPVELDSLTEKDTNSVDQSVVTKCNSSVALKRKAADSDESSGNKRHE